VKYLHVSVIHLSLPSDFREKIWVGHRGRGRDWVRTTFWDRNVDPGNHGDLIMIAPVKTFKALCPT